MKEKDLLDLKFQLRDSVRVLSEHNLYNGAKWSAEALNGLEYLDDGNDMTEFESLYTIYTHGDELDKILLAKTYFSVKEFNRCANVLKHLKSNIAVFIRLYSIFLNGEKKFEEDSEGVLSSNDNQKAKDRVYLSSITKELDSLFNESNIYRKDPFLNYLFGIILLKQKLISQSQEYLINSILLYPLNWSAWVELISSIQTLDSAFRIIDNLKEKFNKNSLGLTMLNFFKIVINQEFFQQNQELYDLIDSLLKTFPNFSFLKSQKALISYHALDYQESEKLFDDILINDPLRLDDLDTYSNILYVMEKKSKLAYLAQLANSIDKFRPESCCIIANYYSLKFEHEKAIMYYRRALTLNRNCLSAWTLMGHEFVELKNSHAAIESYRRAVDTNSKDFKAWYGLGQAYEVLDMHLYSLYYYQQASSLKPLDRRIWIALGNCYEKLNKVEDSIKSYQKAIELNISDVLADDVAILYKIALLFEKIDMIPKVYEFMKNCYLLELNENIKNDETCKARIWLAKYELINKNYQMAYQYASDLNYGLSQDIEEARNIAREARNKLNLK